MLAGDNDEPARIVGRKAGGNAAEKSNRKQDEE